MAQRRRRLPTVSPVTLAGRCRSREGSLVPSPRSGYRDQREKKNQNQTPEASTQQLQSQIPMETAKIPTQPCPYGLLVLAGVGKKGGKNKMYRKEPFAGLFTRGNLAPLEEQGAGGTSKVQRSQQHPEHLRNPTPMPKHML